MMGDPVEKQTPVRLFFALMARERIFFEKCEGAIAQLFGPIDLRDEPYAFDPLTDYYAAEFGTGLEKRIVAVEPLIEPEELAEIKRRSNALELALAAWASDASAAQAEKPAPEGNRVINIDPGYLNLSKVVLASTKDHWHRLYVGQGIFEEITLSYRRKEGGFIPMPWTYPDYRMEGRLDFFRRLRERYGQQLAERDRQ